MATKSVSSSQAQYSSLARYPGLKIERTVPKENIEKKINAELKSFLEKTLENGKQTGSFDLSSAIQASAKHPHNKKIFEFVKVIYVSGFTIQDVKDYISKSTDQKCIKIANELLKVPNQRQHKGG